MPTVDNLLHMDRCASCQRELAAHWKFCVYCGRPFVAAPTAAPAASVRSFLREVDEQAERPRSKYDGPFWVGVGMGALGLVLIVYAAVQIF